MPEYVLNTENLFSTHGVACQEDIDCAKHKLLVEGTLSANFSETKDKVKRKKSKKKTNRKFCHPKWHDLSCDEAHRKVSATARFVKDDPKNPFLVAKLRKKNYNKLVKLKNKQFVDNMFVELDSMERNDPRGYMELIRSMRNGGFDKATSDDTSGITPPTWHTHFSDLLANTVDPNFEELIKDNIDSIDNELNEPFTLSELSAGLKDLKNNKASSFNRVSIEMLKTSGRILKNVFLLLFNSIRSSSFYPTLWKKDILHPIHKSDEKDDPNNFRGIAIASCFGKLFTKLLKNRLQLFCDKNNFISKVQSSEKKVHSDIWPPHGHRVFTW